MDNSAPAASLRFDTAGNAYSVLHRVMCYLEYLRKYFSNHNDRPRYCATSRRNMEGSEQEAILGNGFLESPDCGGQCYANEGRF